MAQPCAPLGPRDHRDRVDRHVVLLQLVEQSARSAPARATGAGRRGRALVGARRRVLPRREVHGRPRRAPPHAPLVQMGGVRHLAHGLRAARAGLLHRRRVVSRRSPARPGVSRRGRGGGGGDADRQLARVRRPVPLRAGSPAPRPRGDAVRARDGARVGTDRAVEAAIGTIMAANVLMVIIPAQRDMVAALTAGRTSDAGRGQQAALRSLHNNYLTLPVLFIMVSSHYPATYGHRLNWAILAGLAVIGVATRHWFNLRNEGRKNAWILPAVAVALVALALVTAPRSGPALPSGGSQASFADVRVIVARRCAACHSSAPTTPGIPAAPLGVLLDTPDEIQANAPRILAVAVDAQTMPRSEERRVGKECG